MMCRQAARPRMQDETAAERIAKEVAATIPLVIGIAGWLAVGYLKFLQRLKERVHGAD